MDYALKRATGGSFGSVTEAVEASIEAHGFVIVGCHDVHATLARKGFRIHPVRIYEVREHSEGVDDSSRPDGPGMAAGMVPGRISVFLEAGMVTVAAVRPGVVSQIFPEAGLEAATEQVERRIIDVVEEAVAKVASTTTDG